MHDEPSQFIRDAKSAAKNYRGSFAFMRQMRKQAQNEKWFPTQKQAIAILKSAAWEASRS